MHASTVPRGWKRHLYTVVAHTHWMIILGQDCWFPLRILVWIPKFWPAFGQRTQMCQEAGLAFLVCPIVWVPQVKDTTFADLSMMTEWTDATFPLMKGHMMLIVSNHSVRSVCSCVWFSSNLPTCFHDKQGWDHCWWCHSTDCRLCRLSWKQTNDQFRNRPPQTLMLRTRTSPRTRRKMNVDQVFTSDTQLLKMKELERHDCQPSFSHCRKSWPRLGSPFI